MKYLVIDPCYVCYDDDVWQNVCNAIFDKSNESYDYSKGAKVLSEYLGTEVVMESTGYGDWSNHIWGPNVLENDFYADAGMVAVVKLTDRVLQEIWKNYTYIPGAIFETEADLDLKSCVEFDTSDSNWTVVRISTPEGLIESDSSEDEDYEDEDEEEDY